MNPYRIYRDEWASALALQSRATEYSTFVAMPFGETFSYRSRDVLSRVIRKAASAANLDGTAKRAFARPDRVDTPMGATVITEEIVRGILNSLSLVQRVRVRLKKSRERRAPSTIADYASR